MLQGHHLTVQGRAGQEVGEEEDVEDEQAQAKNVILSSLDGCHKAR